MKVSKVRAELKTIGTADVNTTITLPRQCHLIKLDVRIALYVRQFHSHFLIILLIFCYLFLHYV